MAAPSVLILDCEGSRLTTEEKRFFREAEPYGFILFARNCETPAQVQALTAQLKETVGRNAPVLIDQEGGRVTRLKAPKFRACPAAGELAGLGAEAAEAIYLNGRLIAHELFSIGINVDCAPVADLVVEGAHDIIGSRAYGRDPKTVAKLAGEMARGLMEGGVVPVVKHMPGHGRAKVDSHHSLPVVDAPLAELERTDFAPFKMLSHLPMAMTAHVVYTALDAKNMATLSPAVIRYIRETLGFDGLLMSDDLTMKAMTGLHTERAVAAIEAGCDALLFCNGIVTLTLSQKREMVAAVPRMTPAALKRSQKAFAMAKPQEGFDVPEAEARLASLLQESGLMHHIHHLSMVPDALAWVLPMLFAITFHEAAHGFMARLFGDYTASSQGRVTLNPLRHVDPFGTVLLPAMLLLAHSPVLFGYAKPVPVSFSRLQPRRLGEMCVAAAGPGMNILLAIACAMLLHAEAFVSPEYAPWLYLNLYRGIAINCVLAVFNLVPILPLDGGRVVHALLPAPAAGSWAKTERFGLIIVIILLFMPGLLHFNLMNRVGQGAQAVASMVLEATGNGSPAGRDNGL